MGIIEKLKINAFTLKIIALITMLIDHIGVAFFPHIMLFRIIGRLSFPIYAFLMVEGFKHTKNLKKYIVRLLIIAIVSEAFFDLLFFNAIYFPNAQNSIFAFALGLTMLYMIKYRGSEVLNYVILALYIILAIVLNIDYKIYGIALVYIYYMYRDKKLIMVCASGFLSLLYGGIQSYAIFSSIFLLFYDENSKSISVSNKYIKYLFYIFYPLHLIILLGIKTLLY